MAPVPSGPQVRFAPVALVGAHISTVLYLSFVVGRGLYRSYQGLGPAQDIRSRESRRKKLIPVFACLAALALGLAGYSSARYAILSYQVWADQHGLDLPKRLFGTAIPFIERENTTKVHIGRWLSDTSIYMDALEIVAEKARRFWWGQQIDLATIPWTLLLTIEGRRRRIPYLWAYLLLAHLVNLSFAQNLFYVALLLTPFPLAGGATTRIGRALEAVFPLKPANWHPRPWILTGLLGLCYSAIFLLPYAAETTSFASTVIFSRTFALALLAVPSIMPTSWGTTHPHPHDVYKGYKTLFRFSSLMSVLLHAKATLVGISSNYPEPHYHRHSIRTSLDNEVGMDWEQSATAFGRILASTSDHPVVAAIARDVVLSAISLGIWAAVRALDANDILASAIPLYGAGPNSLTDDIASIASSETAAIKEEDIKLEDPEPSRTPAKRKSRKSKAGNDHAEGADDETTTPSGTRRRRGARKSKPDPEEVPGDKTYKPSPSVRAGVAEGDTITEGLDWEATALTWGLTTLGGLGCGSAGVYGGECISR
ncbi:uncharacterized protein E0L32_008245 [Thyridium curvatum]|uniref:Uncharacterized protein n=1 Tax=Thyridium curvatum TaxID=1093900 RepID=A0A507AVU5_9PEZI|nr:uncharacterized protein E0L32_008245 [Thyridium curvatum]TPX10856.1 hypothetical protein E0L32_008245 [Thyridium curvatum]